MNIQEIGEFGLIERIKQTLGPVPPDVIVGIDDDAAAYRCPEGRLVLVTTDALVEGVHFKMDYFSFYQLGWRSLAANLSDIAAMAGRPEYAVVSIALPKTSIAESIDELYRGMKDLAIEYDVAIIGGDTTRSESKLVLSITVLGSVEPDLIVTRNAARVGDAIYVTGRLGGALAGLRLLSDLGSLEHAELSAATKRHLTPRPRVNEAQHLRDHVELHAMIDVSDGLASEVHHICRLSGVGAVVDEALIPVADEAVEVAARFGESAYAYALKGGEDFELVFTADDEGVEAARHEFLEEFGLPLTKVGEVRDASEGVVLNTTDGKKVLLGAEGWDHFIA